MEEQELRKDHRWWWVRMLAASAMLVAFMLSLAWASWTLAVRRCEHEMVWSEWDTAAASPGELRGLVREHIQTTDGDGYDPVDESEWDIALPSRGGLRGLVRVDDMFTDWDGYVPPDEALDGPIPAAVPGGEVRRFLRSIWQKVTDDG